MLSRNLEQTLHRALGLAAERQHEYATLEHLLLSLTEDQDAIAVCILSSTQNTVVRINPLHLRMCNRDSRLGCQGVPYAEVTLIWLHAWAIGTNANAAD